jgi:DNA-3-methyladenine glycosylase II
MTYLRGRYATDVFEGGTLRRLLDLGGRLALACVRSTGSVASPRLEVRLRGADLDEATVAEAQRLVAWILGADEDLAPFYHMARQETHLAPLVRRLHGLHIPHTASAFEGLVLAILGQQISTHMAHMLRTLLIETYGPSLEIQCGRYYAFPRPEALADAGVAGLRAIKFSGRKAQYVVDIAASIGSGELDLECLRQGPSEEAVRVLTAIRGAGPWTANWLLIRALGHPDGFPYGDLSLQRTLGLLVNGGAPMSAQEALEYSGRWSPYRSYVTTYLFAAARAGQAASAPAQVG